MKFNSLVTACKDRNYNLGVAFNSWKYVEGLDEIIIIDWSSSEPVLDLVLKELGGSTLKKDVSVVRVEGFANKWVLTWAFNLGMTLANHSIVYKIDADVILRDSFIIDNPVEEGSFVAGNWKLASPGNQDEIHLAGQCGVYLEDFWSVGGYNENITTYGWDDDDLYGRLRGKGLRRVDLDNTTAHHIFTPEESRIRFQPEVQDSNKEIGKNRELARANPWNAESVTERKKWVFIDEREKILPNLRYFEVLGF